MSPPINIGLCVGIHNGPQRASVPNTRTVSGVTDPVAMNGVYQFRGIDQNGNPWWSMGEMLPWGNYSGTSGGVIIYDQNVFGAWMIVAFPSNKIFLGSSSPTTDPTESTWEPYLTETGTPSVTRP